MFQTHLLLFNTILGTLKHCGLKITNGRRFLLVGFLVRSEDGDEVEQPGEQ
jgi:hypothetical protein